MQYDANRARPIEADAGCTEHLMIPVMYFFVFVGAAAFGVVSIPIARFPSAASRFIDDGYGAQSSPKA
ncbi:hypothetical protein [Burkholderia mayonis]|uniref:hypothetical protein n=1 Tax=Burkholderia mayonis TaxID=1385591 RepID=UPI001396A1F9|nr:hypothetical protein [Burkholderia mayonis]